MKPGIYDITNEEYHFSEGISRSGLMTFSKTPRHYWNQYLKEDREPEKSTPAKEFGAAFHPYILEPHLFKRDFVYEDMKVDKRTKKGKEYIKKFTEDNVGKTILTYDEYQTLLGMVNSINADPFILELIQKASYEKSIYWIDPDTGVLCKCRPDILHEIGANVVIVCDLKTTINASEKAFQRSVYNYGYHVQAAMISEGIKAQMNRQVDEFIFIAVEKLKPYLTAIYFLDKNAIEKGREEFKKLLVQYKECLEKNNWPGYEQKYITLPSWAFN
jgi:exodeoxyribonuclease VIII